MRKPVVRMDRETGVITIDGMTLDLDILGRIFDPNLKFLWRFQAADGRIIAVALDERQVIWIEPEG